VGAFVGAPAVLAEGALAGPLAGRTLAVKDLVDVAGTVTGAGNPTFAAARAPAPRHAPAVARLLAAGATVVGKTITDELAYSLSGTNTHFGTPVNVAAPGRAAGGSSAGSAAAVAAGLVDLAVGTDTGGSVRVPASYCGILGWRPTHGAVPIEGVVPLAPSFDTVGLLARDPQVLLAGATALLGDDVPVPATPVVRALLLAEEGLASLPSAAGSSLRAATAAVARALGVPWREGPLGMDLDAALAAFRTHQGREAWANHGPWITAARPRLGEGIRARFRAASEVTEAEVEAAYPVSAQVRSAVSSATAGGTAVVLPSAPGPAATLGEDPAAYAALRQATIRLTAPAGLAGAPAVSLPLAAAEGLPLGLCLVGAPGTDVALLRAAVAACGTRPELLDVATAPCYRISAHDTVKLALLRAPDARSDATVVFEVWDPGGAQPPNGHPESVETFWFLAGEGVATSDGTETTIGPGTLLVLPPGSVHHIRNTGPGRLYAITTMLPDAGFAALITAGTPATLDPEDLAVARGGRS
jgi:amidase